MQKIIQNVLDDIKRGENLDLYLVIPIGFVVMLLGIFAIVDSNIVNAVILAVLTIIAIGIATTRKATQRLASTTSTLSGQLSRVIDTPHEETVQVFDNQTSLNPALLEYISTHTVKKAMIIQCGASWVQDIVACLLQNGAEVHILLQHPDRSISALQRNKVLAFIEFVRREIPHIADPSNLRVLFYQDRATYRAIALDEELLAVSWYTYDSASDPNGEEQVWGHIHPHTVFYSPTKAYLSHMAMFRLVFDTLRKDKNAESLEQYMMKRQI